jgi:hypothetical protein
MALMLSSGLLRWVLLIELVSINRPVIETSLINRTHLSRPEFRRRAIFRNVVNFIFYILLYFTFLYYILFTIKTMHKVQQTNGSQCYIPSSKPFRIKLNAVLSFLWQKEHYLLYICLCILFMSLLSYLFVIILCISHSFSIQVQSSCG